VGELLLTLGRHNVRPNHLHMMIEAPGFHKLVTSLYPEGDEFLSSDAVFGVKKSLVVVSERHIDRDISWSPSAGRAQDHLFIILQADSFLGRNSAR
jgi:protocatechuate 3,4-dioxygenase beta subunit